MTERSLPLLASVSQIAALTACASAQPGHRLLIRTLSVTGLRLAEALNLWPAYVHCAKRLVQVEASHLCASREVYLDIATAREISIWRRTVSGQLFPFAEDDFVRAVQSYAERAGLVAFFAAAGRRFSWRPLRHSFARHAVDCGMTLMTLHRLLGHRFLQTTALYLRVSLRGLRPVYEETFPLVGPRGRTAPGTAARRPYAIPTREAMQRLLAAAANQSLTELLFRVLWQSATATPNVTCEATRYATPTPVTVWRTEWSCSPSIA